MWPFILVLINGGEGREFKDFGTWAWLQGGDASLFLLGASLGWSA